MSHALEVNSSPDKVRRGCEGLYYGREGIRQPPVVQPHDGYLRDGVCLRRAIFSIFPSGVVCDMIEYASRAREENCGGPIPLVFRCFPVHLAPFGADR